MNSALFRCPKTSGIDKIGIMRARLRKEGLFRDSSFFPPGGREDIFFDERPLLPGQPWEVLSGFAHGFQSIPALSRSGRNSQTLLVLRTIPGSAADDRCGQACSSVFADLECTEDFPGSEQCRSPPVLFFSLPARCRKSNKSVRGKNGAGIRNG